MIDIWRPLIFLPWVCCLNFIALKNAVMSLKNQAIESKSKSIWANILGTRPFWGWQDHFCLSLRKVRLHRGRDGEVQKEDNVTKHWNQMWDLWSGPRYTSLKKTMRKSSYSGALDLTAYFVHCRHASTSIHPRSLLRWHIELSLLSLNARNLQARILSHPAAPKDFCDGLCPYNQI